MGRTSYSPINLFYVILVFMVYLYFYVRSSFAKSSATEEKEKIKTSLKNGLFMFLKRSPTLIAILTLVAMIDVFVPKETIVSLIGSSKGILSILLSTTIGSILMGPVATSYPLGMILLKKGASVSSVASFLFAWVMVGIVTLPFEISVFGKKFALVRNVASFLGAMILGLLMGLILTGKPF